MRNFNKLLPLSLIILCLFACKEKGPVIDYSVPQTSKVVLLEEFTGVLCATCPAAHEIVKQLLDQYPDKLIAVSIHTGDFAHPMPYPLSDDTFEIEEAINIASDGFLGPVTSNPIAAVDRKIFDGESDELLTKLKWSGYISYELKETPKVNISLSADYNDTSNILNTNVVLQYVEGVSEKNFLSLMLIEDSIIDAQKDDRVPSGIDTFYVHNRVLRDMFTPYNGVEITEEKKAGTIVEKKFSLSDIPAKFNISHCKVVAFVHEGGVRMNVLQAAISPVE